MPAKIRKGRWSLYEDGKLIELVERDHATWASISRIIGRAANVCAGRYRLLKGGGHRPIVPIAEIDVLRTLPPGLEEDRDRRIAARDARAESDLRQGSVTAAFFGDPPPGYSALDRRRA